MSVDEAHEVLAHFTEAPEGRQVMDGAGAIWTYRDGRWHHLRWSVDSVALAKALNPDIAHLMEADR